MTLELNYGNAVTGAQRFPRPELEERLLRALTNSAGVKMFGLRRIGKSTFRLYATSISIRCSAPTPISTGKACIRSGICSVPGHAR